MIQYYPFSFMDVKERKMDDFKTKRNHFVLIRIAMENHKIGNKTHALISFCSISMTHYVANKSLEHSPFNVCMD